MADDTPDKDEAIMERAAEILQFLTKQFPQKMEELVSEQRAQLKRLSRPVLQPSKTPKSIGSPNIDVAQNIFNAAAAIAIGEYKRGGEVAAEKLLPALEEFLSKPAQVKAILEDEGIDIGVSPKTDLQL